MSTEQAPSAQSKSVLLDTSVLIPVLRGDWSLLQNVVRLLLLTSARQGLRNYWWAWSNEGDL